MPCLYSVLQANLPRQNWSPHEFHGMSRRIKTDQLSHTHPQGVCSSARCQATLNHITPRALSDQYSNIETKYVKHTIE